MNSRLGIVIVLAGAIAAPLSAHAPGSQDTLPSYAVPHDPAFVFLGVTPKVTAPTTGRALMASLVSGVDEHGRLRPGVAIGVQPLRLARQVADPEAYYQDALYRALTNAQLSIGTVRTTGDSGSTDLAIGLRLTLLDRDDPYSARAFVDALRRELGQCFETAEAERRYAVVERRTGIRRDANDVIIDPGRILSTDTVSIAEAFPTPGVKTNCREQVTARVAGTWVKAHWNAWSLGVGLASGYGFEASRLRGSRWTGWAAWLSGGIPVARPLSVEWQLRYDHRAAHDTVSARSEWGGGARLVLGGAARRAFLEVDAAHQMGTTHRTQSFGVEFRLPGGLWLSAGLGDAYEAATKVRRTVLLSGIRWGVAGRAMVLP